MALFTLEALEAKHGDCLILHYGENEKQPNFILIDGGPAGVYKGTLRPRLEEIKEKWHPDEALPLQMVMVSHIDDDHINGVLALTKELIEQEDDPYCDVLSFGTTASTRSWATRTTSSSRAGFESEGRLRGRRAGGRRLSGRAAHGGRGGERGARAQAAGQRGEAQPGAQRSLPRAWPADEKGTAIDFGDGLKLTVLGPNRARVEDLHEKWKKS